MDGLAGIIYTGTFQMPHLIEGMLNIFSRGEESVKELHTFKHIHLGINGKHFATNAEKKLIIGTIGNIYNLNELSEELNRSGYPLIQHNSNELLAHAYDLWGVSFLKRLQGDFAIVILDQQAEKIIIARDPIGKKTLYWFQNQNFLIFSSELKALLSTNIIPQTPAKDAISSYLYFGFIPQDMSPIKEVNKLLPGYFLQIDSNLCKSINSYWSYSSYFAKAQIYHKASILSQLDNLLYQCTKIRIPTNQEIGCFVLGGLGTTTIAHYLSKIVPANRLSAFSIEFQNENLEETLISKKTTETLEIPQFAAIVTPTNFLDNLVKIVWHLNEPIADPHVLGTWAGAELAAKHVKSVFSGMGTGELFAGHPRHLSEKREISNLHRILHFFKPILKKLLIPVLNQLYKPAAYYMTKKSRTHKWHFDYLNQNALFKDSLLSTAAPTIAHLFDPEIFLYKFHHLSDIPSITSSILYFEVKTRLVDSLILQYERMTTAHSLEWHTPILDRNLMEFVANLFTPDNLAEKESSFLLKGILEDFFPPSIVSHPTFVSKNFLSSWINSNNDTIEIFHLLLKGRLVDAEFISGEWLKAQIKTPESRQQSFKYLWAILVLEVWFRLFIDRPIEQHPPTLSLKELLSE